MADPGAGYPARSPLIPENARTMNCDERLPRPEARRGLAAGWRCGLRMAGVADAAVVVVP